MLTRPDYTSDTEARIFGASPADFTNLLSAMLRKGPQDLFLSRWVVEAPCLEPTIFMGFRTLSMLIARQRQLG
jgi:hypothetical protein